MQAVRRIAFAVGRDHHLVFAGCVRNGRHFICPRPRHQRPERRRQFDSVADSATEPAVEYGRAGDQDAEMVGQRACYAGHEDRRGDVGFDV